ncbi:MAG: hypothetical protein HY698_04350 [Deltaproteobacteria bacterium]|nr:hypothetical protein [Deltaproteobacteria bacterium]
MLTGESHIIAIVAIVALGCGEKRKEHAAVPVASVAGLSAVPADVQVLVGIQVPRIKGLFAGALRNAWSQAVFPDIERIAQNMRTLGHCVDFGRDVDETLVAIGQPAQGEVLVVLRGKLDEARSMDCLRALASQRGSRLETRDLAGATAHHVSRGEDGGIGSGTWFTVGGPGTLLVSLSESYLSRARDPKARKASNRSEIMEIVSRVDRQKGAWCVGFLPQEVGKALSSITQGAIKHAASTFWGSLDISDGLALDISLDMADDADATALVDFARRQLPSISLMAHGAGMSGLFANHDIGFAGDTVHFSLRLSALELAKLEERLSERPFVSPQSEWIGDGGPGAPPAPHDKYAQEKEGAPL